MKVQREVEFHVQFNHSSASLSIYWTNRSGRVVLCLTATSVSRLIVHILNNKEAFSELVGRNNLEVALQRLRRYA